MLQKIDRFGLEAITGRKQFYYGELQRLMYAEAIVDAYKSSQRASNWVEWTQSNPYLAKVLVEATKLCQS